MLDKLTQWLAELMQKVFDKAWDFVSDAFIAALDKFLSALASILAAIPVPSFASAGLTPLFSGLGSDIAYILSHAGLPQALALIGSAFVFRMLRKLFTLFQW